LKERDKSYSWEEVKKFFKNLKIPWPYVMNRVYLNRYKTRHVQKSPSERYSKEDIKNMLGWRELKAWEYDYADGYLIDYCWLSSDEGQAGYIPINSNLRKLQDIITTSELDIDNIYRKLTYFSHIERVLDFFRDKYDWEILPIAFEYFLNLFEFLISSMIHMSMFFLQLYFEQSTLVNSNYKPKRFEDIVDALKPIENKTLGFQSIDSSLYLTALSEIRNQMVHSTSLNIERENQEGFLSIQIPHKKRKGIFSDYLRSLFDDYDGKLICDSYIEVEDERFPEFYFSLRVSKKAMLDIPNSIVTFSTSLSNIMKICSTQLFFIAKWSTDQLFSELTETCS